MLLDTSTSTVHVPSRTAHDGAPSTDNKAIAALSSKHNTAATTSRSSSSSLSSSTWVSVLRAIVLEGPVLVLFAAFLSAALLQRVYWTYVIPIVDSYKRGEMVGDLFFEDYANDFTYYNRHCGPKDISTRSSNDLLIDPSYSETEAANVMLEHGAVAFQNVLTNDTATELRAYLAEKHHHKQELPYNEIFWEEQNRLSLGIGTNDHPAIAKAMMEIGNHPVIKRTLEGILGPDPAILEISTLTSLNGARDQGIHTDSDWFGSSLLYSRNFLHSYSMFVALQDTSRDLGATTVCPGSHYCADVDLSEMCLNHGAFEVSTNGHTGEHGILRKGDAFLFNQNIWHRGPRNVDPDGLDRIMFIMTFGTAKDDTAADHRIQGLGTYYYQRFNMWGSTFSMLKDATTTMVQPWAGLRALGFLPTRGVTWIHQFAQQFANGDEFYNDEELEDFVERVLDANHVPRFLRPTSGRWEEFIPDFMAIAVEFLAALTAAALVFYCLGLALCTAISPKTGRIRLSLTRLFLLATLTAASFGAISLHFDQTDLAKSVTTEAIFQAPFPEPPALATLPDEEESNTFPERHDVLISTRLDAKFLASFNRFLSFHPGNRVWENLAAGAANLPNNLVDLAAKGIVREIGQMREARLASRFLKQDPQTGSWSIMSNEEAVQETAQAIKGIQNPLVGQLSQELKYLLADARFGRHRGTVMAGMSESSLAYDWPSRLLQVGQSSANVDSKNASSNLEQQRNHQLKIQNTHSSIQALRSFKSTTTKTSRRSVVNVVEANLDSEVAEEDWIPLGSKVWVYSDGQWYEAMLVDVLEGDDDDDDEEEDVPSTCLVYFYNSGSYDEVECEDVRSYNVFQIGDRVDVDYHGTSEVFFPGVITHIHPDGTCSVRFDDGEHVKGIGREHILML